MTKHSVGWILSLVGGLIAIGKLVGHGPDFKLLYRLKRLRWRNWFKRPARDESELLRDLAADISRTDGHNYWWRLRRYAARHILPTSAQ